MALSKIQAESMNLADTFAFTGTVTGTPNGILQVKHIWDCGCPVFFGNFYTKLMSDKYKIWV